MRLRTIVASPRQANGAPALLAGLLAAVFLLLPVAAPAGETNYRAVPHAWLQRMQNEVDLGRIPGALLLVESPEWGTCLASVGRASLESDQPMKPEQPFRVGPATRTMVSIALLQMEKEWKVRLDARLSQLLGEGIHPRSDKIFLRDLLRMSSGLYNYLDFPEFGPDAAPELDNSTYSPEQILARVAQEKPDLVTSPGGYSFSATDYIAAGMIAERIDGKPLAQILKTRVFDRAGLGSTWFDVADRDLPANIVHGYTGFRSGTPRDRTFRNPSADWAAGAAISTPADMLRFWKTLFATEQLLLPHSYARMTKFLTDWDGRPETARGLGLMERLSDRGTFRGIDGTIPGYYVCFGHYLHRDTYILLFVNTSDVPWASQLLYDNLLRQISGAPNRMRPANDETVSAADLTLQWSAGLLYGTTYRIYVGESFDEVLTATAANPGKARTFQTDKHTFQQKIDGLAPGKTWFWRVDAERKRPEYEQTNDRRRFDIMKEQYPDLEYDFIPEQEIIQGPVFRFTTR